jgi:hypothetical protein
MYSSEGFSFITLINISSYLTGATTIGSGLQYLGYSAFEISGNQTQGDTSSKDSNQGPDDSIGKQSNSDTDIDNQHNGDKK